MKDRIPSSALVTVIVICLIIALVTGMAFTLLFRQHGWNSRMFKESRLETNLKSARTILLNRERQQQDMPWENLDLFEEGMDSVLIREYPWGLYHVGLVRAFSGSDTLGTDFMMGLQDRQSEAYALYLADEDRPLSASGKVYIRGPAQLPAAGLRKSYIEDRSFEGDSIVYGKISNSTSSVPKPSSAIMEYLQECVHRIQEKYPEATVSENRPIPDSLHQPFRDGPQVLYQLDSIRLDHQALSGAIILISEQSVRVKAGADLRDILVFAPVITIEDGFEGSGQFFVSDSLSVGKSCKLQYPSVLALARDAGSPATEGFRPLITIGEESRVEGIVLTYDVISNEQWMSQINLASRSTVMGDVLADGFLQLKGNVIGSVACRRFVLQTSSTYYDNFVLDGQIDLHARPADYVGSPVKPVALSPSKIIQDL